MARKRNKSNPGRFFFQNTCQKNIKYHLKKGIFLNNILPTPKSAPRKKKLLNFYRYKIHFNQYFNFVSNFGKRKYFKNHTFFQEQFHKLSL